MDNITDNTTDKENKIPFKVSARTAKLIGLENFTNEEGAIVELVKNTYDADAKNCVLVFDLMYDILMDEKGNSILDEEGNETKIINKLKSRIFVIDNGHGMTKDVIENQWMTLGTDDKLYEHTSKGGRVKTGAKGIGRFALNRLGLQTRLSTLPEKEMDGWDWRVDWKDFDKKNAVVSDVQATLSQIQSFQFHEYILNKFPNHERLSTLLNTLEFTKGTVIEISELNDAWPIPQFDKLFAYLEMLLPPAEQTDFQIDFFVTSSLEGFGTVKRAYYDDFDYKIEATCTGDNLKVVITRNELDLQILENRYSQVFSYDSMKVFPFRLEDFKQKTITLNKSLRTVLPSEIDQKLIDKVGDFNFTFYFLKNTISDDKADGNLKKYPYKGITSAARKSWLKKFGGVKIFRDDFRVRPYGENGVDWLKLGDRQAQSPGGPGQRLGGYKIGPNQIAGTVAISRLNNSSFEDKSGREGIIENDVFELFKNILLEIISFFEKDRNNIMYHLSELNKKVNEEEEKKRKAQEEAERVKKEQEEKKEKEYKKKEAAGAEKNEPNSKTEQGETDSEDRNNTLADGVQILTRELEQKEDEIRLLRSLASVGLIISSFAHEVKSLRSRLIPRTAHILQELRKHLDEKKLSHLNHEDNPFYMISLMQAEDIKLKHWLDYSLNTLKRDKRERTNLDFKGYFESFKSTWSKALSQRKINIHLKIDKNYPCVIRAFEIDMDSIFNNLLSNSMSALRGLKIKDKAITISCGLVDKNIEIIFADNGKGLDDKYKSNPDEIFNLNESSRTDNRGKVIGTGLGLYIVRTIIQDYNNSTITILSFKEGLQLKLTFKPRP